MLPHLDIAQLTFSSLPVAEDSFCRSSRCIRSYIPGSNCAYSRNTAFSSLIDSLGIAGVLRPCVSADDSVGPSRRHFPGGSLTQSALGSSGLRGPDKPLHAFPAFLNLPHLGPPGFIGTSALRPTRLRRPSGTPQSSTSTASGGDFRSPMARPEPLVRPVIGYGIRVTSTASPARSRGNTSSRGDFNGLRNPAHQPNWARRLSDRCTSGSLPRARLASFFVFSI